MIYYLLLEVLFKDVTSIKMDRSQGDLPETSK